jgi:hypothetical protein
MEATAGDEFDDQMRVWLKSRGDTLDLERKEDQAASRL